MKNISILLILLSLIQIRSFSQNLQYDCDPTYEGPTFMDFLDFNDPCLLELAYSINDHEFDFPTEDDTDIKKTLPLIFEEGGYIHFLDLIRRLKNGERVGEFYYDSYSPVEIPSRYYEDLVEYHSQCDSIRKRFPEYNDIGDLRENYIFYKNGKADRIIQLTFLKGIQLISWDDEYMIFNK